MVVTTPSTPLRRSLRVRRRSEQSNCSDTNEEKKETVTTNLQPLIESLDESLKSKHDDDIAQLADVQSDSEAEASGDEAKETEEVKADDDDDVFSTQPFSTSDDKDEEDISSAQQPSSKIDDDEASDSDDDLPDDFVDNLVNVCLTKLNTSATPPANETNHDVEDTSDIAEDHADKEEKEDVDDEEATSIPVEDTAAESSNSVDQQSDEGSSDDDDAESDDDDSENGDDASESGSEESESEDESEDDLTKKGDDSAEKTIGYSNAFTQPSPSDEEDSDDDIINNFAAEIMNKLNSASKQDTTAVEAVSASSFGDSIVKVKDLDAVKEPSTQIQSGLDLEDTYITVDESSAGKRKILDLYSSLTNDKESIFKHSVIQADFATKESVPCEKTKKQQQKDRRRERKETSGKRWYHMRPPEMTDEVKRDLEVLQMRNVLDPKRFYKHNDRKTLPKYFQMGTIMDSSADFYSSRLTNKQRKANLVDELLADAEFKNYQKRKFSEIQAKQRATGHFRKKKRKKF